MFNENDRNIIRRNDEPSEKIDIDGIRGAGEAARKNTEKKILFGMMGAFILVTAFLILIFALCFGEADKTSENEPPADLNVNEEPLVDENKDIEIMRRELSVSEIYSRCKDSVVSVSAKKGAVAGVGSGFIYSEDGYIATACHVIDGMDEIYVVFSDGRRISARVIGKDAASDTALLKVELSGLKAVKMGASESLSVGDRVVAIGTPASLDYAGSASSGEISYLNRVVKIYNEKDGSLEKRMTLLQTNVPLNPGNSGCPLFDSLGNVVGMVTMKLGNNYTGMGFAIPSEGANRIFEAMRAGEEITEDTVSNVCEKGARLGALGETVSDRDIEGAKITDFVRENCDAALKLKKGDIIISFGGIKVDSFSAISKAAENYSVGDSVSVTVIRGGQELSFTVKLTD